MKSWLILVLLIIYLSGCVSQNIDDSMAKEIILKTDDNVTIYATYYIPESPKGKSVILLHMLRTDRSYWKEFANLLSKEGYDVLAIDLRGHGQSTDKNGVKIDWQRFSEKDFNDMILDVKAAKSFLVKQKPNNKIAIIGASIGANTALNYAVNDSSIKTIVLLSPGLDYRGVKTEESMKKYNRSVLITVSSEDEPAASSSQRLFEIAKGDKEIKIYNNAGHGTWMFGKTDLKDIIINWLKDKM